LADGSVISETATPAHFRGNAVALSLHVNRKAFRRWMRRIQGHQAETSAGARL